MWHSQLPLRLAHAARPARPWAKTLASFQRGFAAPSVQLYQYEICPFCCKLKAFLDWQKVSYTTTEVNPISKAEIKFSKDYRKVPIAMVNGEQVNDSSAIMASIVEELATARGEASLRESLSDPEVAKWLTWVDKELAVLLFPNITRSFGESHQAFSYISDVPSFSAGQKIANRFAGSLAMWLANGKLKKKYNITDERAQLLHTVKAWTDAVGAGPFLKGEALTMPDIAVYGVLSSIRGLTAHTWLMETAPALASWSSSVRSAIGGSSRLEEVAVNRRVGPTAP